MPLSHSIDRFWIAPFALDGELVGVGEWWIDDISAHWINVCASLVQHYGPVFDEYLQGPLSHIRIRCTAGDGGAMVDLCVHDLMAASFVVVVGTAPVAEGQMLAMFAESLRSSTLLYRIGGSKEAFHEVITLPQRPIAIIVPWPQSSISEQDHELVTELARHLVAALVLNLSK